MRLLSCFRYIFYHSWILTSCFITIYTVVDASSVVVDAPMGKIEGVRKYDDGAGESYVSFTGIPYAKPPVGELRFAKPQPNPTLGDEVFKATNNRIVCPHPDLLTYPETKFTEDCLVLNIYAKDIHPNTSPLKKVLVFIHGGGFIIGTAYYYEPISFVISQDVIAVVINYRIGILGFLSTENEASPGNYGLWDQTLALKWVQDNIRAFGGDPYDVTIAGESAGAASVAYQMITPQAKGLFTRAYPQSGTATAVFARSTNAQSHALTIAKSVGCWDTDSDGNDKLGVEESSEIIRCLRKVPVSSFTSYSGFTITDTQFAPVVDGDFLLDTPAKLMGDDSFLESIGFYDRSYFVVINNAEQEVMDAFYLQKIKAFIFMNDELSTEMKEYFWQQVLQATKDYYMVSRLGGKGASDKNTISAIDDFYNRRFTSSDVLLEIVSDLNFLIPTLDLLSTITRRKTTDAYLLYFNYFPQFMKGTRRGFPHTLDLFYWFDADINVLGKICIQGINGNMTDEDLELKRMFSSIIGGFVRTGNPGQALHHILPTGWPKYDVTDSHYLNFNHNPWVSRFLEKDKEDFWFKTIPKLLKRSHHQHEEL